MRCAMPSIRESPTDEPARHRPIRAAAPGGGEHGDAPEPLLQVKDLGVRFGAKQVVRGLNFAIAAGEKLALVGESGSGKTITALSLLRLAGAAACTGQA